MGTIKIHTHNRESAESLLKEITIDDTFWNYDVNYKVIEDAFDGIDLDTNEHYFNLPEFKWSPNIQSRTCIRVEAPTQKVRDAVFGKFGKKSGGLNYIHHELEPNPATEYEYTYESKIDPKYPIYVITKGRWEKRYTIDTLEDMGIDFYICVEPDEYDKYAEVVDVNKIIKLPENFSKRGQGGIPVRNFVWEHSVKNGYKKHWIIDDNIEGFFRWHLNTQKRVRDGVFFRIMEDFSDRYSNLGLVGCQYFSFIPAIDTGRLQFLVNTRTYSCILINTELLDKRLDERWRGRYNEDTDLTLRVLSTGDLCTVNFNNLLSGKKTTGTVKGGNTDTIYEFGDDKTENAKFTGLQKKFDELKKNWGDIVKLTHARHVDGRPHHIINYTRLFKQKLVLKDGVSKEPKVNNYNMIFKKLINDTE